ncbi:hypothetical protein LXA43DRAFT_1101183 [Ganoderma leucocontextum]|nr:hypothetical protein LXA43DRAFT_1101183 [Ganoderma leucocontextum]
MSLCTTNGITAPALWADKLPEFDITPYNSTVTFDWRHIPDSVDEFYDWATIADLSQAAIAGEKWIVHTPTIVNHAWPSDNSELYEVAIVVHGFVSAINPSLFVSYSREQHTPAAFADMTEGAVPFATINDNAQNPSIRVQQNVFMKLHPSDDTTPSSVLTDHVDRGWHADANELAIQSHAIRAGDFVELTITSTIRPIRRDTVLQPTLFLNITKVIKLWAPPQELHPPHPLLNISIPSLHMQPLLPMTRFSPMIFLSQLTIIHLAPLRIQLASVTL